MPIQNKRYRYREINGETFRANGTFPTKRYATSEAKRLRRQLGGKARIVKSADGWRVFSNIRY